ncbi:MAG: CoA transferase subunit A [Haloarculaceae archaeon]
MSAGGSTTTTDAATAVSRTVDDGDSVYLAGFGHLVPYALGHELIRQSCRDLTLVRPVVIHLADQIVAAGCASKVVFSWLGGPATERALADGLPFEEYSHYGMVARLSAGARKLPFAPLRSYVGSDLPAHNDRIRTVESPYGSEEITVLPPLAPDVTLVHAQRADPAGNAHVLGLTGDVRDAVLAAETVVLSVEEIVDPAVIAADPARTIVLGEEVDYLVEAPFGAHPSYAHGYYDTDRDLFDWPETADTPEGAAAWLDEWVYGLDRGAYLDRVGVERLLGLRPAARTVDAVNWEGDR